MVEEATVEVQARVADDELLWDTVTVWYCSTEVSALLRDFLSVYRLYRRCQHPRLYCARIAWDMTVHRTPF